MPGGMATIHTENIANMKTSQNRYDALVVGGGMVGAAAATGLAQAGWSVALLEHQAPQAFEAQSPPDLRISAIGCTSVGLLKQLGARQAVTAMRTAPYRRLETGNGRRRAWRSTRCPGLPSWALWWKTAFCSWRCGSSSRSAPT